MSQLDTLSDHFDTICLSAADWPVRVMAAVAGTSAIARWPDFPVAATLAHGRLGHGAGPHLQRAATRAVGELVEIASCCAWGDEPLVEACLADVAHAGWGPEELTGFSSAQRRNRPVWNAAMAGLDWIAPPVGPEVPLSWMRASLADRTPVLVPADAVLIGRREAGDPAASAVADTSGCAAGETPEAACLSALYELIERDATGRWWYGRGPLRPISDADAASGPAVTQFAARGRHLRLFDITSDLGVPTAAALATDADGRRLAAGFATRGTLGAASTAAFTELLMMELRHLPQSGAPGAEDEAAWFHDAPCPAGPPPADSLVGCDLAACLARLTAADCRVAFLDMTRPAFGVPVVRALSPDLCHWKPRFGRSRLTAGCVDDAAAARLQHPDSGLFLRA